ncbi:MAG: HAD-IIIA family hydrolase [Planctomycetes bacterium]|nr:HAD-IIIA family hydrolase [Planctomycetota bacterium]
MAAKAVFLDRDNTIIRDPGYISDPSAVQLLPGVTLALKSLTQAGFKIVVVTNQSGVARGLLTEQTLAKIHEEMRRQIAQAGAAVDGIYYCPYHPEGSVAQYAIDSDLRKPAPGMLLKAAHEMNLDLASSWMVGDSARDIEAGKRAGCKTIRIVRPAKGQASLDPDNATPAEYRVRNLVDATRVILRHAGREQAQTAQAAQTKSAAPPAKPQEPPPEPEMADQPAAGAASESAVSQTTLEELAAAASQPGEKQVAQTQSPQELSLPESQPSAGEPQDQPAGQHAAVGQVEIPSQPQQAEPPARAAAMAAIELTPGSFEDDSHKGEPLQMALTPPSGEAPAKAFAVESKSAPSHVVMPPDPAVVVDQMPKAVPPAAPTDEKVRPAGAGKVRPDDEFAWASLAGGIAQMIVIGPLAMAIIQIFKQEYSACAAWALLACVFQVMALTCYTIHRNK